MLLFFYKVPANIIEPNNESKIIVKFCKFIKNKCKIFRYLWFLITVVIIYAYGIKKIIIYERER